MGGLCTGLILKKNGIDFVIYEKEDHPGGSFWTSIYKGYKIDTGLHMLTRGKTGELPVLMREFIDKDIFQKEFVSQKAYRFFLGDKNDVIPKNLSELLKFKLLNSSDRMKFLKMYLHFLRLGRSGTESYSDMTSYGYAKKFIGSDNMLYFLNALCWMSTGCNIKEGALERFVDTLVRDKEFSFDFIMKHIGKKGDATEGDWYPVGGLKRVPELFMDQGLDVKLNNEVEKIVVEDNKVKGVKISGKFYPSDIVIYDGMISNLSSLIEGGELDIKIPKQDDYEAITIWLGFDQKIASWDRESRIIIQNNLDSPHWGVFLTDFDPGLAPEGHQLFGMSAILHKDKEKLIEEMKESIEKLIPDYKDKVVFEHIQVDRAEKTLQKAENSMWNLPEQKTNIEGLYVVGTDTKAFGSGGTMCAGSARRCWNFIKKDYNL